MIAISASRSVVSLYLDGAKYILEDIPVVLAKANQALATLDKYRSRLDQVSTRLTALEFEGGVTLHDVLTVLQRAELVTRMAVEIERYIVELGAEGRLIEMQLEETMVGSPPTSRRSCATTSSSPPRASRWCWTPCPAASSGPAGLRSARRAARLRPQAEHPRPPRLATRLPHPGAHPAHSQDGRAVDRERFRGLDEILAASDPELESVEGVATCARRTSARAFAACRRSTSWTATCKPDQHGRRSQSPTA